MKAPLLIQIDGDARSIHTFPSPDAFVAHIDRHEERAKASGAKTYHAQATRQARKTDVLVIYQAGTPAPLPTPRQVRAILKQYKEGAR